MTEFTAKRRRLAAMAVPKPATVEDAIELRAEAGVRRGFARRNLPDCPEAAQCWEDQAALAERRAARRLKLPEALVIGAGGETVPPEAESPWRDTLREGPDQIAASASASRVALAGRAGVLTDALDMAQAMKARSSVEKAHAHQLAALHQLSMAFAAAAADMLRKVQSADRTGDYWGRMQQYSIEACRLANAAAKCTAVYQEGMAVAQRAKQGIRQHISVQYVQATRGGQAIVNGGGKMTLARRKQARVVNGHRGAYAA